MASALIINGQNLGADISVSIQDSLGRQYAATKLGLLQDVEVTFQEDLVKTKTIVAGGLTVIDSIPGSITIKLGIVRANGNCTALIADYRTNYFNGTRLSYNIQCIVRNPDGSVDTWLFTACKPHNHNFAFKPDSAVSQGLSFEGQDITTTSPGGANSLFTQTSAT
jgi:hypothetical protein